MSMFQHITQPTDMNVLVAFFDLTVFSRYARDHSDREIFNFLADYYGFAGEIIEEGGGTVVKFMGDAGLAVFPEDRVDSGVLSLRKLKTVGDKWMRHREIPCRHVIKAHFGPVIFGPIGTRNDKRFDVFGTTVNTAALLKTSSFAITPQAFRRLEQETRKLFKKHTPPVTYIQKEDKHQD